MGKATKKKASRLDREINVIAARVRRSRQYSFGELRRQTWIESEAAMTRETDALIEDVETGADGILLARSWSAAVQLDLANLLADSAAGSSIRFVIGAWADASGGIEDEGDEGNSEQFDVEDDYGEGWDADQDLYAQDEEVDDDDDLEGEGEGEVEWIGVRDPGGVADEAVRLAQRVGRDCDLRALTHLGIQVDGRSVHVVEVVGMVQ